MTRILAACVLLVLPGKLFSQDSVAMKVVRKVNVFYLTTGEKKMEANLVITGGDRTGFVKISESVKGVTSLILKGKLRSDVAVRKDDTSLTWIFPEISGRVELHYACTIKDTTVHVHGNWITEKNPVCADCIVSNDTTLAYTPQQDLYVLTAAKNRQKAEKLQRQWEENERLKKIEEEKKRVAAEKAEQDRLVREEKAKQLREQQEKDRIAAEEKAKLLKDQQEKDRIAREEKAKIAAEEKAKQLREQQERDRLAAEEKARLLKEQQEKDRIAREEKARLLKEQQERDRIAAEEKARLLKEQQEKDRIAREEKARLLKEQQEKDRIAAEEKAKLLREQQEKDRLALAEKNRLAAEEKKRIQAEKAEKDRIAREEKARLIKEQKEKEMQEKELARVEAEKKKQELQQRQAEINRNAEPDAVGCSYRIQLAASVNAQNKQVFLKRLPAGSKVYEEQIDQWYKYTTGCFNTAEEAVAHMAQLENLGFKKPFMVKYTNGVRTK